MAQRLRDDKRWEYGVPPVGNANFAWVQHFLYHLAPRGTAGFVLANGSMSSNQSGEGEIRKSIIEAGLVECISGTCRGSCSGRRRYPRAFGSSPEAAAVRARQGETLFIDTRQMGHMLDRTRRDLSSEDIARVADTYHAWLGKSGSDEYADVPGFCKSATLEEIRKARACPNSQAAMSGRRHRRTMAIPFEEKMAKLAAQWQGQQADARRLD